MNFCDTLITLTLRKCFLYLLEAYSKTIRRSIFDPIPDVSVVEMFIIFCVTVMRCRIMHCCRSFIFSTRWIYLPPSRHRMLCLPYLWRTQPADQRAFRGGYSPSCFPVTRRSQSRTGSCHLNKTKGMCTSQTYRGPSHVDCYTGLLLTETQIHV